MVYDQLWKCKKRVAAYHAPTITGVLAYYDGTVLDESDESKEYAKGTGLFECCESQCHVT